jgi:thermolabile hemolysin
MKRTNWKFLLPVLMLSGTAAMAQASAVKPDPEMSHYLSSSGPLSVEEVQKMKSQKVAVPRASRQSSSSTYTYLRCFYRTSTSNTHPTTDYVWANSSSGGYYEVNGYWQSSALVDWQNIFYTSTSQATLQSVCQSTLNSKGITGALALVAAADNSMSYNYQIWSNDSGSQGNAINKIIAFGDSLSDNHNMYNLSDWIIPDSNSWFVGHFSNGNNWVEYTAANLNLPIYDWAVGDAGVNETDLVIPSLIDEEQSWASTMQSAQNYQAANTLFTVLIGANDIKSGDATVAQVVADETQMIQSLISSGAKNILVLNLPDISRAPVYSLISGGSTVQAEVLQLNSQLVTMVSNLRSQYGVNIQLFDTYTLFNTVLANPSAYGVSNTTNSCLNINSDSSLNYAETQSPRSICTNADTFVFWDTLHPTTHTHKLLAQYVTSFIQQNFGNISTTAMKK